MQNNANSRLASKQQQQQEQQQQQWEGNKNFPWPKN